MAASLAETYTERMRCHPYGFALYHPASSRELRPGCVGLFNSEKVWTPIAHLEDSESLAKYGLLFPTQSLTVAKPQSISGWTPKVSSGVIEKSGGADAGLSHAATGLPANARLRLEYESSSNSGAVLITASPVVRKGYYYQSPFKEWVRANAKKLLSGPVGADIKEHGLFLVTQTYATEKVALTAWQDSAKKAYFGFGVGAMGLGEISPHVQWYTGTSESGWNIHVADAGESKVVFAAGLSYQQRWSLSSQLRRTDSPSRGSDDNLPEEGILIADEVEGTIELQCEAIGKSYAEAIDAENTSDDDNDEEVVD